MNVEIEGQNIIILFWTKRRAVSFLGIHKLGPNIYIGFSPALHLQCGVEKIRYITLHMKRDIKSLRLSPPPPPSHPNS
jgi:hypothetical protein